MPSEHRVRFMKPVGTRAWLRVYWGNDDCPNSYGKGHPGIHNAKVFIGESQTLNDWNFGGNISDYPDERWPTKCEHCPAIIVPVPDELCSCGCGEMRPPKNAPMRSIHHRIVYEAQDGTRAVRDELQPGDMYWADWYGCNGACIHGWTNCDGKHLILTIPYGQDKASTFPWDINGRASNCTKPNDTTHRCWVKHGNHEANELTVNKAGATCDAGGGSIQVTGYHGVVTDNVLRGDD
jgi:hypothetical protein